MLEIRPDPASGVSKLRAFRYDLDGQVFRVDQHERVVQFRCDVYFDAIIEAVVRRIVARPEGHRFVNKLLNITPRKFAFLELVILGIDDIVFRLIQLRRGSDDWNPDDVQDPGQYAVFVTSFLLRYFSRGARAHRPNPFAISVRKHLLTSDTSPRMFSRVRKTDDVFRFRHLSRSLTLMRTRIRPLGRISKPLKWSPKEREVPFCDIRGIPTLKTDFRRPRGSFSLIDVEKRTRA